MPTVSKDEMGVVYRPQIEVAPLGADSMAGIDTQEKYFEWLERRSRLLNGAEGDVVLVDAADDAHKVRVKDTIPPLDSLSRLTAVALKTLSTWGEQSHEFLTLSAHFGTADKFLLAKYIAQANLSAASASTVKNLSRRIMGDPMGGATAQASTVNRVLADTAAIRPRTGAGVAPLPGSQVAGAAPAWFSITGL